MSVGGPKRTSVLLGWLSRDARLIILARGLRTFAQASVAVLLGIYLDLLGLSLVKIGLFLSIGLAGGAFFAFLVVLLGSSLGRRRLLTGFTLLTGTTGLALAFSDQFLFLAVVAFLGSFAVAGGGPSGPIQPLEQATLPETVPPERRTDLFAVYGMVATGAMALGALAAGLPPIFQSAFGVGEIWSYKIMFVGYTLVVALAAMLYSLLSPAVEEVGITRERWSNPFRLPSRRIIFTLASLNAVDNFGTRLITQSLVALWFSSKFGIELGAVALIFGGTHLITAASLWMAAKLANRFGLVNTIVFTHVPAVLLLMAIPFLPSVGLATAFWLVRGFFSQMDVPAKQSYTMAVVAPNERIAMAGIDNLGRSVVGAASPSVAVALWSSLWAGVPFIACGILKALYLMGLYTMFRNVRPPEEQVRAETSREP